MTASPLHCGRALDAVAVSPTDDILPPTLNIPVSQISSTNDDNGDSSPAIAWKDDPSNPHNWPAPRKYINTFITSAFIFNTLMSSTMVAPALSRISHDLHIKKDTQTQLVLSIFVLSYAFGYFVWAPLSEVYGRKQILQIANLWFFIWNLVCGFATNEATITVGRLFSGAGGAAALALGSGALGEVWRPAQRGRSLAVLSLITNLGPVVGPVIGGAIAQRSASSWRWAFWSTSIFNGLLQIFSLRFLHETHRATIQRRKGPTSPDDKLAKEHRSIEALIVAFKRPFYLLYTYPTSQGMAVYSGVAFGTMYILLTVIPIAFTTVHNQSLMTASLNYLAFGIGTTFGAQLCGPLVDFLYRRKVRALAAQANTRQEADESLQETMSQHVPPEVRLYPLPLLVIIMSGGLLVFGWTLQARSHWIGTCIGIFMFASANQAVTQCTNAYTIDIFSEIKILAKESQPGLRMNSLDTPGREAGKVAPNVVEIPQTKQCSSSCSNVNWSASAMAAIWAAKSLGGFTFPLFAVDMIQNLHWGWSGTLLAAINLVLGIPLAIVLLVWGPKMRRIGESRMQRRMKTGKM